MTPRLQRRDLAGLLGIAAAAALAVSLGVDPRLATELAAALALFQVTAVLLRPGTTDQRPTAAPLPADAHAIARETVDVAMAGPFGAQGRFRQVVRAAVHARLARRGREPDDAVLATLPPALAALLTGSWEHERGLTATELAQVLTAVEELEP